MKDAIHFIFYDLPRIDTKATPAEIQQWKNLPELKKYFTKLFKKVKEDQPTTYMKKILDKTFREIRNAPKVQIAFAISIAKTYLNPTNQVIQMNEQIIKPKLLKNMVSLKFKTYKM